MHAGVTAVARTGMPRNWLERRAAAPGWLRAVPLSAQGGQPTTFRRGKALPLVQFVWNFNLQTLFIRPGLAFYTWSESGPGSGSDQEMELARTRFEVKRRPAGSAGRADRRRRIGPRRRNFQRSKTPTGSPTKCRVHFGMCAWCCEFLTGARACVCARVRVHRWAYVCLCTCTCI